MATAKKRTAAPRKTAKTIRNLRGTLVHLRLFGEGGDKPYRIELKPRGMYGDVHTVPANLIDNDTFVAGVDVLFEIITKTEANKIEYAPQGYQGIEAAKIVRDSETVISRTPDVDTSPRGMGPTYLNTPGSDADLHAKLAEGNAALPSEAFPPATVVRGR